MGVAAYTPIERPYITKEHFQLHRAPEVNSFTYVSAARLPYEAVTLACTLPAVIFRYLCYFFLILGATLLREGAARRVSMSKSCGFGA
jgi:hypothetical protein